ncbi:DedA family protein [Jatrophihabitans sp. YIM 134969]
MPPTAAGVLDTTHLIGSFGLIGLLVIVFAETGLLVGFFLPGDSLLFAAGVLIAGGVFHTPLVVVAVLVPVAATAGSVSGYWIGRRAGPPLFDREDGRIFRRSHLLRAAEFFERRGTFAVVAGRFVPVVRTFVTVVAGASRMDFRRYVLYSAAVSAVWGAGLPIAGYLLGSVPVVADHVELFTLGIAFVSIVPVLVEAVRSRRRHHRTPVPTGGNRAV